MFEGLVRQLLLGYLGRYVKDIQKEQLKITLWHEEILLENVELILEAFDYLRLPFALKQGRIGRLSIKIPWKKLGWDPIIIVVDNVFICACQRDDEEWSSDSVERREFAGKKAKLAAAELAKLSRRVCDNQAGQSFISYITEKIIDGIQVSIKNVDVLYVDQKSDMGQFVLGLRFSSLMIINRNPIGSSALKPRSSQVNKIIEISNLGIYCSTFQGNIDLVAISNVGGSQLGTNVGSECYKYDYILAPFDMAVSLVVNRPGRPETGGPQYYISAELTSLVMLLDEIQLQQIYKLWDYLCTCHLREKYGRFRPWYYPLSGKPMGWQRMWWHFAQESVLSDVRKKLKKNAWKYLAHRISYRRKYVSLYKIKLKLLLKDQPLDEDILRELEQMEKESDLDDILSYRSIAEDQLQESPPNSKTSVGISGMNIAVEKQQNDESLSSRSRGWLNWLSRGMLGAGGTDDSGQFSGIISDEIIKDIYEATMFHPMPSLDEDSTTIPRVHLSLIKFNIHKITSALGSKRHKCKIVELNFDGVVIECKLWEESVSISALVNSAEIICPRSKKVVLLQKKRFFKKDLLRKGRPFITVQVDRSLVNHEIELLVKIMLEPFEVSYHSEVLLSLLDFYYLLDSFESQQERVISSLNGFENTKARVLSKSEYVFLNRNKVIWDVCLSNVIINIPWRNEVSESFNMVLESSDIVIKSSGGSGNQDQHDYLLRSSSSASTNDIPLGIELQNFYDLFEISVSGFEVNIIIPDCPQAVPVFERFTAHITLASCIIPDESMLKQLEVNFVVTSLNVHLSPSLYGAVVGVISYLHVQQKNSEKLFQGSPDLYDIKSSDLKMSNLFQFSLSASLKLVNVHFNLADDSEDSMALIFGLGGLDIQYDLKEDIEEYWVCVKTLKIDTCAHRHESESHLLCLSMNMSSGNFAYQNEEGSQASSPVDDCGDTSSPDDACFLLHYQAQQTVVVNCHKYTIFLNDVDLHCYPHVVRSLHGFCDKISAYGSSSPPENHGSIVRDVNPVWFPDFGFQKFGFTNFFETGSSSEAGISLDHFPFVTIFNSEPLGNLGSSLIYGIPDWRKLFHVIGRKTARSPKLSTRMGSRIFDVPELKLPYNLNSFPLSGSSVNTDLFAFNFIFNGIRVHFHDSSCILGTVTVPTSRSLLYICENYWDIFCSAEGLIFSSSWFSQNFHEYLWGPLLPNLSPILNVRVKNAGESFSQIEISIGIQHTCCVLPFEFLSMLIGYFSLSDWSSSSNDLQILENSENKIDIRYKFEILDSMLIFPLEGNEHHSLLFGLQQLYCNFIPMSNSEDAVKDIPTDCLVPSHKVAATIHLLNVFMRDLSLSLRLLKTEGSGSLKLGEDTSHRNISLVSPLNADLWLRIPCECNFCGESSSPTCIMMRICNCQLIAEDGYLSLGLEAVLSFIIQMSSVGQESKRFTSNVLQFLQLNRSSKESNAVFPDTSGITLSEAKCCIDELSIKFFRSKRENTSSELVAEANLQLQFSASFENEIPICLDVHCSSLVLYSFHTSVILVQHTSSGSASFSLDIHLSKPNELLIVVPLLKIWLHMSAWYEITELLGSYASKFATSSIFPISSNYSVPSPTVMGEGIMVDFLRDTPESPSASSSFQTRNIMQGSVDLIVKSVNIGLSLHFPIWIKEYECNGTTESNFGQKFPESSSVTYGERVNFEPKQCKYILANFHSRDSELFISGRYAKLKSVIEKTRGMLLDYEDKGVQSWPFFLLNQVSLEAEICQEQEELLHSSAEVRVEGLDVWLSHQIFYLWSGIQLEIPETGSSQFSFGSIDLKVLLRKASVLLTDGRGSSDGPLFEILMRNLFLHNKVTGDNMEMSFASELLVNYNNIHEVLWEPFIEPWNFQININRKNEKSALLNTYIVTDIHMESAAPLNLNLTEPLLEAVFRATEMIKESWGLIGVDLSESLKFLECETNKNVCARRYAPYVLKNETSLPLLFYVYRGIISEDDFDVLTIEEKNVAQPGSSVPIYIDETPEEQIFSSGPTRSSNRLNEKKSNKVVHHMVSIQLDGTSMPSNPISMDLIGISYFEVDFSKASDRVAAFKNGDASMYSRKSEENRMYQDGGYIFPVVFDVSLQRYGKLIRLYSTVIIFNATSMPLELRFDIPFGVSPKVLDPIYPGQKFPLPLHLAEAGCMRWRPLGNTFLWSDAHQLSNISSQENRPGFLRSFVCYPSHPSSDPFRCCMLFQDISLSSSSGEMKGLFPPVKETLRRSLDKEKRRFIHEVIFTSPLLVKNYLPRDLSFTIESGGVTRSMFLSEVDSASIYYIDVTHDMGIEFHMDGFKPSTLKFPRAETFISVAKLSGTKFSLTETMTFYPDSSNGPLYVIVEKVMDAFCGARELCISVPFLLYNCTGLSLSIEDCGNTVKGNKCNIPSCYHLAEQQKFLAKEDGLSLLCSNLDSHSTLRKVDNQSNVSSKCGTISLRENVNLPFKSIVSKHFISIGSSTNSFDHFENDALDDQEAALSGLGSRRNTSSQSSLIGKSSSIVDNDSRKVKACMYSPHPNISASELMVRVRRYKPEYISEDTHTSLWSSPFFLVPASGSTCVVVPQSLSNEAYIISVTSNPVTGPFSGRTRAVTFQPRYVISNACSKDLCYRQKGTDFVFHLGTGQHSELHWSDRTRELLISIRFNEPGCLWSGSFSPDHLGDTQVKIRNYFLSTSNMVRVEVQNADVSVREEKIIGSPHGNSGTHLILLSDDNTGFMPYRIDNFSKERLRVCQQKCENSETIVHPYTSCLYAWDEPCYPRRLLVEVPGECILGLFALDDARDHLPICIPSNSEKPERKFFLSVHAEGAVKVLSVIDLNNHLLIDNEDTNFPAFKDKKKPDQKQEEFVCYTEKILVHISFIGISLINCDPQELLFVCAKDTKIDVVQSVDQQKFSFQISSLQIDNQLRNTLYPVILSFDHDCMFNSSSQVKNKDKMHIASDNSPDPIFCLSAAKWRNKDVSLVSFEYISLRFAAVRLEIEEDVILSVLDFIRSVISRLQTTDFQWADSTKSSLVYENNKIRESLPSVVPIGAPWQQIYCLAGWKKKIYVELFDLGPIKLTVSFSSTPWLLRNGGLSSSETLVHFGSSAFQRGLMALADVEGAQIYLKQLTIAHHMASLESIEEILIRHYTWQLIHEIYKIFGSAGVIGNPMGFARNVGLGIKDFLSVPSKGLLQSPTRLITGVAQGTTSLFSTTVYAISDATTQFSKAAHKGIVAFTYDEQAVAKMGKQHKDVASQSKGVLNEVLEGLTGLLQSPIKGAEKHGLLGILSGMALGIAGLVARPVAGILEVTGKTAQSIRNRSSRHQPKHFRVRLPRPLSKEMPLRPYSWEEAIGSSMLLEAKGFKLKDEIFVTCKALKQSGKFVTITKRLILVFSCSSLEGLGTPGFCGISDPEWTVEVEMGLEDVIHVDREAAVVNIVGSSSQTLRQHHLKRGSTRTTRWNPPHLLPLFQTSMEFVGEEEAEDLLQVLLSIIERGREQGWGLRVMHQSSLR